MAGKLNFRVEIWNNFNFKTKRFHFQIDKLRSKLIKNEDINFYFESNKLIPQLEKNLRIPLSINLLQSNSTLFLNVYVFSLKITLFKLKSWLNCSEWCEQSIEDRGRRFSSSPGNWRFSVGVLWCLARGSPRWKRWATTNQESWCG